MTVKINMKLNQNQMSPKQNELMRPKDKCKISSPKLIFIILFYTFCSQIQKFEIAVYIS